jgi:DNA modification methylase/rubredoxin
LRLSVFARDNFIDGEQHMSGQANLNLSAKASGPVECLGQIFESDKARREHYTELLREKLKDPDFRKIEGFPIGEDDDILALSDPPYYTACPNPWIQDFVEHYGRPYDPKEKYHREPFAADVSEGKNHPIYNAHSYHTKVPHRAIMRYILHYTEPGDFVFDGFCGTGMTGVAAQLCGDRNEVQSLGYRIDNNGNIYNEEGKIFSKLGARRAVLNDLSPAATFISYNYNSPVDADLFENEATRIIEKVEKECGWMFETKHSDGRIGRINYTVWSDIFICPECSAEVVFWDTAVEKTTKIVRDEFTCPSCQAKLTKRSMEIALVSMYDQALNQPIKQKKQVPVLINYIVGKSRFEKIPDSADLALIAEIDQKDFSDWYPKNRMMVGHETRRNDPTGLTHVHHFYTQRNLRTLANLLEKCEGPHKLLFQSIVATLCSKLVRYNMGRRGNGPLSGTLYVSSLTAEGDVTKLFLGKVRSFIDAFVVKDRSFLTTQSFGQLLMASESMDYLFIDPPFGSNLNYSELNYLWESWLKVQTDNEPEAIENSSQQKGLVEYRQLMTSCFNEAYRVLKPGRWMTVEFSNTKANVWNSIQTALIEAGFIVTNVSALDKIQKSFKAVMTPTAVKQDLVISAYKPNGGLEKRFARHGDSVAGVWDFLQTHLKNLPVVKPKGGALEFIAERDPRILYDRMVAFYIGHNIPVPLSSGEFQAALHEKYPERDGMVFLHEQVAGYDKKRAQMENVGQLSIFVEDEKSAINWLRGFLKNRPSITSDITPEFMQQLSASWKKFETRPELSLLLDQNFIKYDGVGDVPNQLHSYLSTQYKNLRKLSKTDTALKKAALDKWYVPDPQKAVDVEALRDKRLLAEFWSYLPPGYVPPKAGDNQIGIPGLEDKSKSKDKTKKLKEVRTEAVRVGFKHCHQNKDYATIMAVASVLPTNVIEEDEQLQMIYDMAEIRSE